jgi:hypothetical protein
VLGREREVDEFLAQYGKPPRSAVRALLDPSDENIAAMQAEQVHREIVAAYIAQRLTEMQTANGEIDPRGNKADLMLSHFVGVSIVAYVPADCGSCREMYRMLRRFARNNPAADVRLAVISETNGRAPLSALLTGQLSLPASTLSPTQAAERGIVSYPVLEVDDARTGERRLLSPDIDAEALRDLVIALCSHNGE